MEFKRIEDRAVKEAIALQTAAGLDVITDGEMRRYAFYGHFIDATEGFDKFGGWAIPFRDEHGHELVFKRPVVMSRLRRRRSMCTEEFAFLRASTDRPVKMTLINAQQTAAYYDSEKSKDAYPTVENYLADVVDILRAEVEELVHLGCTYIQLDAPQYTGLIDPAIREGYRSDSWKFLSSI
jgi:5-methyltetrahydropteroyltriglutamate--homocysteine methyltransferase